MVRAALNKAGDRLVVGGIMSQACHVFSFSKNYFWNADAGSGGDLLCVKVAP